MASPFGSLSLNRGLIMTCTEKTSATLKIHGARITSRGVVEQYAAISDYPTIGDAVRQFAASFDSISIYDSVTFDTLFSAHDEGCFSGQQNIWRVDQDDIGAGDHLPKKATAS